MSALFNIARTGVTAALLHPLRSMATVACLLTALVPYLAGTGLTQGLEREAKASIRYGADLYVSREQMGRPAPIPVSAIPRLREIEGVTSAVPRVVGQVEIGADRVPAVVVGLQAPEPMEGARLVQGRLFRPGDTHELVVGTELARRLHLRPGSRIPPFYSNPRGERISTVTGIFQSDVSLWQSRMIFTSFETATAIFAQEGLAGDVLVYCRPGAAERVRREIERRLPAEDPSVRLSVLTRSDLEATVPAGIQRENGVFQLHFLLAFVAGTLAIMVSSAVGLPDRRREIGILKATGWQTDEILLRSAAESGLISLGAASLGILIAYGWLRVLNGVGIAGLFLPGAGFVPSFTVPFDLTPIPAFFGFLFAWLLVSLGSLPASWRAAVVSPREALR